MGEDESFLLKQHLRAHVAKCSDMLELLHSNSLTQEQASKICSMSDMVRYEKSQTISNMAEARKFIELINGIPSVAVQGYNKNREVIYWNSASEIIYGYSYNEAIGEKLEDLIVPEKHQAKIRTDITDWFEKGIVISPGEMRRLRKDQTAVHVFASQVMVGKETGNPELFCVDIDLTELASLKDANSTLEKQAHFDKLTNVYNRHYFDSVISQKLSHMIIQQKELSIIMFDIDFFKNINDEHGHDIGDRSLVALIQIVKEIIREDDLFIRWGGDEFILLLEAGLVKAALIANKIRLNIEQKTAEIEQIPNFTCSFGVVSMNGFDSFEDAYKVVDEKLYLAKNNGRNRVEC